MEQFYSCDYIAEKFGVKRITVWQWIREHKLEATRIGREYRISETSLKNYVEKRSTFISA